MNDQESGPFTSEQLKKLAQSGNLKPDDLVRLEDQQKWRQASSVKGLINAPTEATTEVKPKKQKTAKPSPSKKSDEGWSMVTVGIVGAGTLVVIGTVVWFASALVRTGGSVSAIVSSSENSINALIYSFEPSPDDSSKYTYKNVHVGAVNWTATFEGSDAKGSIKIKQAKSDRPIDVTITAAIEAIPIWQAIPGGTEVRFTATLTPDVLVHIYGSSGNFSGEFEGHFNALAKGEGVIDNLSNQHQPTLGRAELFVIDARPIDPVPLEGNAAAEAFVKYLEQNGAVISRDAAGRTTSISYVPSTGSRLPSSAQRSPLDQTDPQLTDAAFERLADLPELWYILVASKRMTGKSLAVLERMPKLKSLALMNTQIGDADLTQLKNARSLSSLTLSLSDTITDAGLVHLKQLSSLDSLDLSDTKVTPAGLASLRENLPNLSAGSTRKQVSGTMFAPADDADRLQALSVFDDKNGRFSSSPYAPLFLHGDELVYLGFNKHLRTPNVVADAKIWNVVTQEVYRPELRYPMRGFDAAHPTQMQLVGIQQKRDENQGNGDRTILFWDMDSDQVRWESEPIVPPLFPTALPPPRFNADGSMLGVAVFAPRPFAGETPCEIQLFATVDGTKTVRPLEPGYIKDFAFDREGRHLAVLIASQDNSQRHISLIDVADGLIAWTSDASGYSKLRYNQTGDVIVSDFRIEQGQGRQRTAETGLNFIDAASGNVISTLPVDRLRDFDVSYDGRMLALARTGETNVHIDLLNMADQSLAATLVSQKAARGRSLRELGIQFGQSTYRFGVWSREGPSQIEFWELGSDAP
ncbi:MAG: GYF domain-containing protein [Planctomycetaceae bacterium]